MSYNISVIGAGSWGTALAIHLSKQNHRIYLWHRDSSFVEQLKITRENTKYLPGIIFNDNIQISNNIEECIMKSEIVILAVASHAVWETAKKIKPFLKGSQVIVNVAKGIDNNTLKRMSEIISQEIPNNDL